MLATLVSVTVIWGGAHAIQIPPTPGVVAFEDAIRVVDRISLHETENVLNVVPEVALDSEGGFVVGTFVQDKVSGLKIQKMAPKLSVQYGQLVRGWRWKCGT